MLFSLSIRPLPFPNLEDYIEKSHSTSLGILATDVEGPEKRAANFVQ